MIPLLQDLATMQTIQEQEAAYFRAGGTTVVVRAPGKIERDVCESVSQFDSVVASGSAVIEPTRALRAGAPLDAEVWSGTPGLFLSLELLNRLVRDRSRIPSSAWRSATSSAVMSGVGLTPLARGISVNSVDAGQRQMTSIVEISDVIPEATGAVLVDAIAAGRADYCVIVGTTAKDAVGENLVGLVSPTATATERETADLLTSTEFSFDPTTAYAERTSRELWLLGALLCPLVWAVSLLARRSELGIYLSVGLSRLDIAFIRSLEYGIIQLWAALTCLCSLIAVTLVDRSTSSLVVSVTVWQLMFVLSASFVGGVVVSVAAAFGGSASEMVKDR